MTDADQATELTPPPRTTTPLVRRRAWAEPTVRFWWLLALALVLLAPLVGSGSVQRWRTISRLIEQPPVKAKLLRTEREDLPGRPIPPGARVWIQVGQGDDVRTLEGNLEGRSKGPLPRLGDTIDVRIDPDNRSQWTIMDQAPSLAGALITGVSVAAISLIPLGISLLQRRRVLRSWRTGEVRLASVVSRQQTALAPGAYALKCAWIATEGDTSQKRDRAIFNVFLPKRLAAEPDQPIEVLADPAGGKSVALDWFRV